MRHRCFLVIGLAIWSIVALELLRRNFVCLAPSRTLANDVNTNLSKAATHFPPVPLGRQNITDVTPPDVKNTSPEEGPVYVKVIIPGFGGNFDREQNIEYSIDWLRALHVGITCFLFVYKTEQELPLDNTKYTPCEIVRHKGFWLSHLASLTRQVNKWRTTERIVFWLADAVIPMPNVNLRIMLNTMEANCLDVLSLAEHPGKINMHRRYPIMAAHEGVDVGRLTDFVEFQFMLMSHRAFLCLLELVDVDLNPGGLGTDVMVFNYCLARMGIVDKMTFAKRSVGGYSKESAVKDMFNFLDQPRFTSMAWTSKLTPGVRFGGSSYGTLVSSRDHVPYECSIPSFKRIWCWLSAVDVIESIHYDGENITHLIYGDLADARVLKRLYLIAKKPGATLVVGVRKRHGNCGTGALVMSCTHGLSTDSAGWEAFVVQTPIDAERYQGGGQDGWIAPCAAPSDLALPMNSQIKSIWAMSDLRASPTEVLFRIHVRFSKPAPDPVAPAAFERCVAQPQDREPVGLHLRSNLSSAADTPCDKQENYGPENLSSTRLWALPMELALQPVGRGKDTKKKHHVKRGKELGGAYPGEHSNQSQVNTTRI